ncbi:MAG: sel1 repeat family protein, partial [Treponema sp.]|nr:sel1 repeat family protein [Treponema sp.]
LAALLLTSHASCKGTNAKDLLAKAQAAEENFEYEKAFSLYQKAAELGDPEAQCSLARIYDGGFEMEDGIIDYSYVNYDKEFYWYSKAAEQGYADGIFGLGSCYLNSKGVERDFAKMRELFELAAQKDSVAALCTLGSWYLGGFDLYGIPDDPGKAKEYLTRILQLDNASDDAKNVAKHLLAKIK